MKKKLFIKGFYNYYKAFNNNNQLYIEGFYKFYNFEVYNSY